MVHFPALPSPTYVFSRRYGGMTRRGFPHSDTPGSKLVCSSPRLFAAYCVLHRLLAPRHSPYALSSLTIGIDSWRTLMPFCSTRLRQPLFCKSVSISPSLRTLRVLCGSEKTTVCRIFSCQRTIEERRSPNPSTGSLAGAQSPAPLARSALLGALGCDVQQPKIIRPTRPASPPSWPASPKPRREPRWAKAGGEYRARTGDPLVANQVLSQLS